MIEALSKASARTVHMTAVHGFPCRACVAAPFLRSMLVERNGGRVAHVFEHEVGSLICTPAALEASPVADVDGTATGNGNGAGGESREWLVDTVAQIEVTCLGRVNELGKLACAHRQWRDLPLAWLRGAPFGGSESECRRLLQRVCRSGSYDALCEMLGNARLCALAEADWQQWTSQDSPLHLLCATASVKVVTLMLDSPLGSRFGANHAATAGRGGRATGPSCLHIAAKHGNIPVMHLLMSRGANCRAIARAWAGEGAFTTLHFAALSGSVEACECALKAGCEINDATEIMSCFNNKRIGITPLHLAVASGSAPVVSLLLMARASPNASASETDFDFSEKGLAALHMAARQNNVEICRMLCEHGADPSARASIARTSMNTREREKSSSASTTTVTMTPVDFAHDEPARDFLQAMQQAQASQRGTRGPAQRWVSKMVKRCRDLHLGIGKSGSSEDLGRVRV